MNKIFYFIIIIILINGCSINKNSKFWTNSKSVSDEESLEYQEVFPTEEALKKEFNSNLKIRLTSRTKNKTIINNHSNNNERLDFDGDLKKISSYRFSKIKNFIW